MNSTYKQIFENNWVSVKNYIIEKYARIGSYSEMYPGGDMIDTRNWIMENCGSLDYFLEDNAPVKRAFDNKSEFYINVLEGDNVDFKESEFLVEAFDTFKDSLATNMDDTLDGKDLDGKTVTDADDIKDPKRTVTESAFEDGTITTLRVDVNQDEYDDDDMFFRQLTKVVSQLDYRYQSEDAQNNIDVSWDNGSFPSVKVTVEMSSQIDGYVEQEFLGELQQMINAIPGVTSVESIFTEAVDSVAVGMKAGGKDKKSKERIMNHEEETGEVDSPKKIRVMEAEEREEVPELSDNDTDEDMEDTELGNDDTDELGSDEEIEEVPETDELDDTDEFGELESDKEIEEVPETDEEAIQMLTDLIDTLQGVQQYLETGEGEEDLDGEEIDEFETDEEPIEDGEEDEMDTEKVHKNISQYEIKEDSTNSVGAISPTNSDGNVEPMGSPVGRRGKRKPSKRRMTESKWTAIGKKKMNESPAPKLDKRKAVPKDANSTEKKKLEKKLNKLGNLTPTE